MPKKTVFSILVDELLDPFFIFQLFACGVFFWEEYTAYAICILVISFASILMTVIETRKNNDEVRRMALYKCPIKMSQNGALVEVSSE